MNHQSAAWLQEEAIRVQDLYNTQNQHVAALQAKLAETQAKAVASVRDLGATTSGLDIELVDELRARGVYLMMVPIIESMQTKDVGATDRIRMARDILKQWRQAQDREVPASLT